MKSFYIFCAELYHPAINVCKAISRSCNFVTFYLYKFVIKQSNRKMILCASTLLFYIIPWQFLGILNKKLWTLQQRILIINLIFQILCFYLGYTIYIIRNNQMLRWFKWYFILGRTTWDMISTILVSSFLWLGSLF